MKRALLALVVLLGFQSLAFAQGAFVVSLAKPARFDLGSGFGGRVPVQLPGNVHQSGPRLSVQGIPSGAEGTNAGGAVAFAVVFVQCNSLTTWSGVVSGGTLKTTWTLIYTPPQRSAAEVAGIGHIQPRPLARSGSMAMSW